MADEIIAERVIALKQRQFSIKDLLAPPREAAAEPVLEPPPPLGAASRTELAAEGLPSLDDLSPLPGPGSPYVAYARASNKAETTLVLLLADASARGFGYANLDTVDLLTGSDAGQGPDIKLRFYGVIPQDIRIAGRHLDFLYHLLRHHRTAWIRERPPARDFGPAAAGETVITSIRISKVDG